MCIIAPREPFIRTKGRGGNREGWNFGSSDKHSICNQLDTEIERRKAAMNYQDAHKRLSKTGQRLARSVLSSELIDHYA